jgi:hypothetical protein
MSCAPSLVGAGKATPIEKEHWPVHTREVLDVQQLLMKLQSQRDIEVEVEWSFQRSRDEDVTPVITS